MVKKRAKRIKPENYFYTIDGAAISSIKDLAMSLDTMNDDVYYYHVTEDKNDFSSWIGAVFSEKKLAKKMLDAKTKEQCQIVLLKYLL